MNVIVDLLTMAAALAIVYCVFSTIQGYVKGPGTEQQCTPSIVNGKEMKMKVYKVELMVLDWDDIGADGIKEEIENARYGNRCISPKVVATESRDIGEWTDEHPLNQLDTAETEFNRLFNALEAADLRICERAEICTRLNSDDDPCRHGTPHKLDQGCEIGCVSKLPFGAVRHPVPNLGRLARSQITEEDKKMIDKVVEQSRCVLQWWFEFACNIENQGWISDKQRAKLATFDYASEMSKDYSYRRRRKPKEHWASLDHDDISDFTGEPGAMDFFS